MGGPHLHAISILMGLRHDAALLPARELVGSIFYSTDDGSDASNALETTGKVQNMFFFSSAHIQKLLLGVIFGKVN